MRSTGMSMFQRSVNARHRRAGAPATSGVLAGVACAAGTGSVAVCWFLLSTSNQEQQRHDDDPHHRGDVKSSMSRFFQKNLAVHMEDVLSHSYKRSRRRGFALCEEEVNESAGPPEVEEDGNELLGDADDDETEDEYTEAERFELCLAYHRTLYFDYNRRWNNNPPDPADPVASTTWPRRVPKANQIQAIEADWDYCRRRNAESKACRDVQFRIACYYIGSPSLQDRRRAWILLKALAVAGHADGMCYYGMILRDGLDGVVDASPEQAVIWLKRCMEHHPLHIASTFEFAKAIYLGDGIPENLEVAVELFLKTAHLGHAGAAYMLGECLLEGGVGVDRDRADALEWLVTAAELGHKVAQTRVLAVLRKDSQDVKKQGTHKVVQTCEKSKWAEDGDRPAAVGVTIERRYTLGPSPPAVLARRMSKLEESRGISPPAPPPDTPEP